MSNATDTQAKDQQTEKRGFEAEVAKLLKLMVHSVYSEREIFLRELISNASDASDKLRYEAQSDANLLDGETNFAITITADSEKQTLTISDHGIGMDRDDLINNLGTIARSGTEAFAAKLTGDAATDVNLIGQFGVGFYASFMVADRVSVLSRKAGSADAYQWESDGEGSYTVTPAGKDSHGTDITLYLKEDAAEFLLRHRLTQIIKSYSDHIALPIFVVEAGKEDDDEAQKAAETQVNEGSALWTRNKSDITEEQYTEFYRHVGHAFDEPSFKLHYRAEGMQDYTVLLYIPTERPMDLFDPARKNRVKLYVKKVFISDDNAELIPSWLRFVRGVVDSQDLPLNISREMLQNNPVLRKMSSAITKKIVSELEKLSNKDSEKFTQIWETFGPVIKEGLYEDFERRDQLLKLLRVKTTKSEGKWISLADYVSRMQEKQSAIYYINGDGEQAAARSPQLEGFKAKDVEVVLLFDAVDDFWLQMVTEFDEKPFKSITRGGSDLAELGNADTEDNADDADKPSDSALTTLITLMKDILGERVSDIRTTDRLVDTSACLVADDDGMDMHLEKLLKMTNKDTPDAKRILEINPKSALIKALVADAAHTGATDRLADPIHLVLDQARILEGEGPEDVADFARRLSNALAMGIK